MKPRQVRRQSQGFGMLEVLVAMVLVTSVGVAIVLWVDSSLNSIGRLRNEYDRLQAARLTQDWMRAAPLELPIQGKTQIGPWYVRWHKKELGRNPQVGVPSGIGQYDIVLYEYSYSVYRHEDDELPWFDDQVTQVLAPKVRDFRPPFAVGAP